MVTEEWHPDIIVTDSLVKKCIEKQFNELAPISSIKCIGSGWDNKAFLINEQFIFRFPHRQLAVELIERENAVLKYLQSVITLEIPNPIYIGMPTKEYPYAFHGYPLIKATSSYCAHLSLKDREKSIIQLATFLKQLHGIDEQQAHAILGRPPVFDRTNVARSVKTLRERTDKIIARGIANINISIFEKEMKIAKNIKLPPRKVLVHGDLYCPHLMFNEGKLTGIIDWGDVGVNNPSVDLAVVFSFFPPNTHDIFLDIYGDVDAQTWGYARFLGLYSALSFMLYGHDVANKLLGLEGMDSVKRINPELVGG